MVAERDDGEDGVGVRVPSHCWSEVVEVDNRDGTCLVSDDERVAVVVYGSDGR
jgi:hypothetical protein